MKKRALVLILAVVTLVSVCGLCVSADIDGTHGGDLWLFEFGEDRVTEEVECDVLAFSSTLTVTGHVGGSIRAIASTEMVLNGEVDRNVTVFCPIIECGETFSADDALLAGSELYFSGHAQSLTVYAEAVVIGGTVEGSVYIEADQVILLQDADLSDVKIVSQYEPVVAERVTSTEFTALKDSAFADIVTFEQEQSDLVSGLKSLVFEIPAAILLALLWIFIAGKATARTSLQMNKRPVRFLARGVGLLFAVPVPALILMAMTFTLPIGVLMLLAFIALMVAAKAITAGVLGRILLPRMNPYAASALIAAVLTVLSAVPVLDTLLYVGCILLSSGAVASLLFDRRAESPADSVNPDAMDFQV